MKKVLNILKLNIIFIFLTMNSCVISNESSKERIIKSVLKEISIKNNCKIEFELNNSTKLNLSVTENKKQQNDFLNGFIVLEVFEKLKRKGFSNFTIQIATEGKPKEYLKLEQKGYEKIIKMKSRSKSYVELVIKDKKKFYDLFYFEIKNSIPYSKFLLIIEGNLKNNYPDFGGFLYSRYKTKDCFFFKWKELKNDIIIGLNEKDSLIYDIEFLTY